MSQEEFRRELGRRGLVVSQATVSRWERGVVAPPAESLSLILEVLHGTLGDLDRELGVPRSGGGKGRMAAVVPGDPAREAARAAEMEHRELALELAEEAEGRLAVEGTDGSPEDAVGSLLWLAHAYVELGMPVAARRVLVRVGEVEGVSAVARAREIAVRACLASRLGDRELVRELVGAYREGCGRLPSGWRAWCSRLGGMACREVGLEEEAVELLREAVRSYEAAGDRVEIARTRAVLAVALVEAGRPAEAEGEAAAALATARELGLREAEVMSLVALGAAWSEAGRPDDGVRVLRDGAAYARRIGMPGLEFSCRFRAWRVLLRSGPVEEAGKEGVRLRELVRRVPPGRREVREYLVERVDTGGGSGAKRRRGRGGGR